MQRNAKRLQQSPHIQAHLIWKFVTPPCLVIDPLLQRSLEMKKALAATSEPQLFANVVSPFLAAGTATVWKADLEGVFVACFEVCYAGADGGDDPC
jgi:hypothetical protein